MKLNEKIAALRKAAGMSQEELAARCGVSRQAVSKWELGDATPEVDKILALAQVFLVSTDELLGHEVEKAEVFSAEETQTGETGGPVHTDTEGWTPGIEQLPHGLRFLGKMIRRWGYIAGYILALEGLGVTVIGCIARYLFSMMFTVNTSSYMEVVGITAMGVPEGLIEESLGFVQPAVDSMSSIPLAFTGIIILFGVSMIVAGLVLAWYLKKKFGQNVQ